MKKVLVVLVLGLATVMSYGKGAIVETGEDVREFEGSMYFDCFGEWIYTYFTVPYRYHIVTSPSGKKVVTKHWLPNQLEGYIIGLDTDRVWDRTKAVANVIQRFDENGMEMMQLTLKTEFVEQETGHRTIAHEKFMLHKNGQGDLVVMDYSFECKPLK